MSVLSLDNENKLQFDTQTLVGRSVGVLGITGSGKTNTAATLIEELLLNGLPLTIIDIEGEYWGLKERFEVLVAGRSQHSELEVTSSNAAALAEFSVKRNISVILDLSDFTQEEIFDLLIQFFTSLWNACSSIKQPYQIVLEEAHEFLPQSINSPLKQILTRIALRGRKRGLGIILISQRSAKVEKDVLTQTSLMFLHKVVHPVDLKVYKDLIPLPSAEVEQLVRKLQPGEAIVLYSHQVQIARIRVRQTFHVGSTPTYNPNPQPNLRKLDEAMLLELRQLLSTTHRGITVNDELEKASKRIKELEEVLSFKEAEIQRLQSQVELLSRLSISVEGLSNNSNGALPQSVLTNNGSPFPVASNKLANGQSRSEASLTVIEQRKFESLVQRIQKLPKLERSILRLLAEHEGTAMSIPTMATWLSLKVNTLRSKPPHDLLQMKLVSRTRHNSGFKYQSSFSSYLRKEFPQIDSDLLLKYIFG